VRLTSVAGTWQWLAFADQPYLPRRHSDFWATSRRNGTIAQELTFVAAMMEGLTAAVFQLIALDNRAGALRAAANHV